MQPPLSPIIAATTHWLTRAYPATIAGAIAQAQVGTQARQAVMVAAWLRYPSTLDAELVALVGPGGSGRLDSVIGAVPHLDSGAWRTWVDEVVASWAACLLADRDLALAAVAAVDACEHAAGLAWDFRRLTEPDQTDNSAAALLRHPDLLAPVAELHRAALLRLLQDSRDRVG